MTSDVVEGQGREGSRVIERCRYVCRKRTLLRNVKFVHIRLKNKIEKETKKSVRELE